MIEHITDDAYNRQGDFREKRGIFTSGKRNTEGEKAKQIAKRSGKNGEFLLACTQIGTQIF